jgi:RNA recognition motif-containing protein
MALDFSKSGWNFFYSFWNYVIRTLKNIPFKKFTSLQRNFSQIFVGGLNGNTTPDSLKNYFSAYGEIKKCVVRKAKEGHFGFFGFVTFASPASVQSVFNSGPHCGWTVRFFVFLIILELFS